MPTVDVIDQNRQKVDTVDLDDGVFNLEVSQCSMAPGAPIDNVIPSIDEAFLIELYKNRLNRPREAFIHSESFPAPVTRTAKSFQLVDDNAPVLGPPFPNTFRELLPANLMAACPFSRQGFFNHILRSDTSMVRAGLP